MINRFYYTLDELKTTVPSETGWNGLLLPYTGGYTDSQYTTTLYNDVKLNYGDDYIVYIDIEAPAWEYIEKPTIAEILITPEYKKQVVKFMNKIKAWLDDSKYKYEKLIKLYADNENKLMDQVKSESSTQFNDTPQTTISGLDSDEYATTYTKNKTAIDSGTVMARLSEVRAYWESLYSAWVKEFSKKFVYYI